LIRRRHRFRTRWRALLRECELLHRLCARYMPHAHRKEPPHVCALTLWVTAHHS
ncbi:hypothetical protein T02_5003, partial [Trichinella nativa]